MQIFTLRFYLKKMMGLANNRKSDNFIKMGLTNSFEPTENSVKNIMAYAQAYKHDKSEMLGDVDYIVN